MNDDHLPCGFLWKQRPGTKKKWKRHFFVLRDTCLFYYRGPEEHQLLGVLPLGKAAVIDLSQQILDQPLPLKESVCWDCKSPFGRSLLGNKARRFCGNCRHSVCSKCSTQTAPLPQFGIDKPVPVCLECFHKLKSGEGTEEAVQRARTMPSLSRPPSAIQRQDLSSLNMTIGRGGEASSSDRRHQFIVQTAEQQILLSAETADSRIAWIELISAHIDHREGQSTQPELSHSADASSSQSEHHFDIQHEDIQVLKKIGAGSFGSVFQGRLWGTPVAVKTLSLSPDEEQQGMDDLKAEISILAKLRHPNVILYIGACLTPPNTCIVTEWCSGGCLKDILDDRAVIIDARRMLDLAMGTVQGLNYLHSMSILHLDVKAENILLSRDWQVKVSDFGLSKTAAEVEKRDGRRFGAYEVIGTPEWMAPEIMEGQPYTEKVDIYSFGVFVSELVTRQTPYHDRYDIKGYMDVVEAVLDDGAIPSLPAWSSEFLEPLILQCINRNPSERPTFDSVIVQLSELISQDDARLFRLCDVPRILYDLLVSTSPSSKAGAAKEIAGFCRRNLLIRSPTDSGAVSPSQDSVREAPSDFPVDRDGDLTFGLDAKSYFGRARSSTRSRARGLSLMRTFDASTLQNPARLNRLSVSGVDDLLQMLDLPRTNSPLQSNLNNPSPRPRDWADFKQLLDSKDQHPTRQRGNTSASNGSASPRSMNRRMTFRQSNGPGSPSHLRSGTSGSHLSLPSDFVWVVNSDSAQAIYDQLLGLLDSSTTFIQLSACEALHELLKKDPGTDRQQLRQDGALRPLFSLCSSHHSKVRNAATSLLVSMTYDLSNSEEALFVGQPLAAIARFTRLLHLRSASLTKEMEEQKKRLDQTETMLGRMKSIVQASDLADLEVLPLETSRDNLRVKPQGRKHVDQKPPSCFRFSNTLEDVPGGDDALEDEAVQDKQAAGSSSEVAETFPLDKSYVAPAPIKPHPPSTPAHPAALTPVSKILTSSVPPGTPQLARTPELTEEQKLAQLYVRHNTEVQGNLISAVRETQEDVWIHNTDMRDEFLDTHRHAGYLLRWSPRQESDPWADASQPSPDEDNGHLLDPFKYPQWKLCFAVLQANELVIFDSIDADPMDAVTMIPLMSYGEGRAKVVMSTPASNTSEPSSAEVFSSKHGLEWVFGVEDMVAKQEELLEESQADVNSQSEFPSWWFAAVDANHQREWVARLTETPWPIVADSDVATSIWSKVPSSAIPETPPIPAPFIQAFAHIDQTGYLLMRSSSNILDMGEEEEKHTMRRKLSSHDPPRGRSRRTSLEPPQKNDTQAQLRKNPLAEEIEGKTLWHLGYYVLVGKQLSVYPSHRSSPYVPTSEFEVDVAALSAQQKLSKSVSRSPNSKPSTPGVPTARPFTSAETIFLKRTAMNLVSDGHLKRGEGVRPMLPRLKSSDSVQFPTTPVPSLKHSASSGSLKRPSKPPQLRIQTSRSKRPESPLVDGTPGARALTSAETRRVFAVPVRPVSGQSTGGSIFDSDGDNSESEGGANVCVEDSHKILLCTRDEAHCKEWLHVLTTAKVQLRDEAQRHGYLWRMSKRSRRWERRYFVLIGPELQYFASHLSGAHEAKGVIYLCTRSGKPFTISQTNKRKHCVKIHNPVRTYYLAADSGEEIQEWFNSFRTNVDAHINSLAAIRNS